MLQKIISKTPLAGCLLACAWMLFIHSPLALAEGFTADQFKDLSVNPNWVASQCDAGGDTTQLSAGTGQPDGATFPKLDPTAMANSIDQFIKKTNPNSTLIGLGKTIVASSQDSNINPFLIVAIANKESGLGNPSDFNVSHGNNSFGRTAAAGQPSFQGSRSWYKWTSVKASVDSSAPENKASKSGGDMASYLAGQYSADIKNGDIVSLFMKYAPPGENDTTTYINNVKGWIKDMVDGTGTDGVSSASDTGTEALPASCCPASAGGAGGAAAATDGSNSAGNEYSFLIGKGLKPITAAAITGNNIWESGGSQEKLTLVPTSVNSIGATGIAQWYQGRAAALKDFASKQGKPWTDLGVQLDYLWKELTTTQKPSLDATKAASTIDEAAVTFEKKFEVSGDTGSYPVRIALAKKVLATFGGSAAASDTGSADTSQTTSCGSASADSGAAVKIDGYAWPVDIKKSDVNSGYPWPCKSNCHHDNTPAFDLSTNKAVKGDDADVVGKSEFAINDGTVTNVHIYDGIAGCFSLQLKADDGYYYYYTHFRNPVVKDGDKVKAGDKLAEVGERKCTGNGSYPHLHIDRGFPKGQVGGYATGNRRDPAFVPLINKLYAGLPN